MITSLVSVDTIVKTVLIVLVFGFIAILIIKRFLYFKPTYEFIYPQAKFEDIMEGGIHALFLPNPSTNKVVLFCHGNAGNVSTRQDKVISLNNLGYSVLIFDYRGFGQSRGVPSEENCYQSACIFTDMLIKRYNKENIVIYGESLGAAVAAHVALKYGLPVLILESGMPSISSVISSKMKALSILSFIFYEFDTVSYLKSYRGRALVLHGRNDEIISWDSTKEMRDLAEKVIELEGSHNHPVIPYEEIKTFIETKLVINESNKL